MTKAQARQTARSSSTLASPQESQEPDNLQLPITLNLPSHLDLDVAVFIHFPKLSSHHRWSSQQSPQRSQLQIPSVQAFWRCHWSCFKVVEEVQWRRLPNAQRIICRICNLPGRQSKLGISCQWKWGRHGRKFKYKFTFHTYTHTYIYICMCVCVCVC